MHGKRPPRPEEARNLGLFDSVWEMVKRCWEQDPAQRPEISEVLDVFKKAAAAHALVLARRYYVLFLFTLVC